MHNGQRPGHPSNGIPVSQQQRTAAQQNSSQSQSTLNSPSANSSTHPQIAQTGATNAQIRQSQMAALHQAMQGMPQSQVQANMASQMRTGASSPENLRMAMGHRAMQANGQQGFQQIPHGLNQSNLAAAHMAPATPNMQNQAMLAALANNVNGNNTGPRPGSAASPRMNQPNLSMGNASQLNMLNHGQNGIGQPQPLSSGVVPMVAQIQHHITTANPQLTPEQVRSMTNDRLKSHAYLQRQAALTAAAGNTGINNIAANMMPSPSMPSAYSIPQQGGSQSPQQQQNQFHTSHVARMLQQQQRQQAQSPAMMQRMPHTSGSPVNMSASPVMSQPRPVSRSATPMQRQGSGNGMGMGSPMMGQAGMR
jgi:chromatin modification-related protein VID21